MTDTPETTGVEPESAATAADAPVTEQEFTEIMAEPESAADAAAEPEPTAEVALEATPEPTALPKYTPSHPSTREAPVAPAPAEYSRPAG